MSIKSSPAAKPAKGEIWDVDLDPTVGREQSGIRPALIVSADLFNMSPRDLVIVLPITGTHRGIPSQVPVNPPEGGLTKPSVIMTENIRSVSTSRLIRRRGVASPGTMNMVKLALEFLLDF
ncbi:type II toxin-antitoxin system PemK/MazF family toxin [Singulisphaera rosea]